MSGFGSFREIHDAYDGKKISPTELVRSYLDASKKDNRNAYLTICEERAVAQARRAEERLKAAGGRVPRDKEPLFGIPLGIKDVLTIEGVRTTCGSKMLENYVPPYTATAVE